MAKIRLEQLAQDGALDVQGVVWDDAEGTWKPGTDGAVVIESGFEQAGATDCTVSFTDGTRTYSIAPTGASFAFWSGGVRYVKTSAQTKVITDVEGVHFLYFDENGDLQTTTTWTDLLITYYALCAVVYWDATNGVSVIFANEAHGRAMDSATHLYLHHTVGARLDSGLDLGSIIADGDGDSDTHAQCSLSDGDLHDEDLEHNITDGSPQELAPILQAPFLWREGATGAWRKIAATNFVVSPTGTGRAAYNEWTGATWQRSEVGNNNFTLSHLFATNDARHPMIWIMGQAAYATRLLAEAGALVEINALQYGEVASLLPEFVPIATLILQTADAKANAVKSSIESTGDGDDFVNWKTTVVAGGGSSATDATAIHTDGVAEISSLTEKTTPVSADVFVIEDSAASYGKKKVLVSNLPGGVDTTALHKATAAEISAMTAKTTPVSADVFVIEDSADSYNKKKVLVSNLPGGVDTTALHKATAGEIAAMTAKATPVSADLVVIEDSAAADAKKKATLASIFAILSPGPVFDGYDSAGGTSTVGGTAVPLGTERQKTSDFTHSTSTANSEVTVAVAGRYIVHAEVTTNISAASTSRSDSYMWLELDTGSGFAEVDGTRGTMYNRQNTQGTASASCTAILDLDVGDKLRIWAQRKSGAATVVLLADGSRLIVTAMRGPAGPAGADGADGATGATGAGANIIVQDGGVTVGTVMDRVNFGTGLTVTNDGNGDCTVDAAGGGGPEEYSTWDATGGSTTSTSFQTIETLTFTPNNAGEDWLIEWGYEWKVQDADERCYMQIYVDGATAINEHYDVGLVANAFSVVSGCFQLSALSAASHTIAVQYHPFHNWTTMTIKNIFIRARSLG